MFLLMRGASEIQHRNNACIYKSKFRNVSGRMITFKVQSSTVSTNQIRVTRSDCYFRTFQSSRPKFTFKKIDRKMSVMPSRAKIGAAMLEMTRTRLWQKASTTPFFQNVVVSAINTLGILFFIRVFGVF